jgi:hypothetical protein
MSNFEYVDLPPVPSELYADIYNSLDTNPYNQDLTRYKICNCPDSVYRWAAGVFDLNIYNYDCVNAQEIVADLPIHYDYRRKVVYNFLIDPGNNAVQTNFYKEKDPSTRIETWVIEPRRWHCLKVENWHNVTGVNPGDRRIALCVFESIKP